MHVRHHVEFVHMMQQTLVRGEIQMVTIAHVVVWRSAALNIEAEESYRAPRAEKRSTTMRLPEGLYPAA